MKKKILIKPGSNFFGLNESSVAYFFFIDCLPETKKKRFELKRLTGEQRSVRIKFLRLPDPDF